MEQPLPRSKDSGRSENASGASQYVARSTYINAYADQASRELNLARCAIAAVIPASEAICSALAEIMFSLMRVQLDEARGLMAANVVWFALKQVGGGRANWRDQRFLHDIIQVVGDSFGRPLCA